MSQEKEGASGWPKKKYLYLDKFERHVEDDSKWKSETAKGFKKLKAKVDSLLWVALIGACLSMAALLVSVMH